MINHVLDNIILQYRLRVDLLYQLNPNWQRVYDDNQQPRLFEIPNKKSNISSIAQHLWQWR